MNVWRTVWRITLLMFGCKGIKINNGIRIIMGFSGEHSTTWLFLSTVSRLNWHLQCLFLRKEEYQRTQRIALRARSINQTQATVVKGKHPHHCTIPTPLYTHLFNQTYGNFYRDNLSFFNARIYKIPILRATVSFLP